MSLYDHAVRELDLLGLVEEDEMNGAMRKHLLHMVEEFSKEGHSGFSASYAIGVLDKLLKYEPVTPLTGEAWEWVDVAEQNGSTLFQNKRCGRVFKGQDGKAWDIDGKIFYEWMTDPEVNEGQPYKVYYSNKESHTPIEFPYTPVTTYEERKSEENS